MKVVAVTPTAQVLVVKMSAGRIHVHIVFSLSACIFSIFISDICADLGLDVHTERARIEPFFGELGYIERRGADGVMHPEYFLPLNRLEDWLKSIPSLAATGANKRLRACRANLYQDLWRALRRTPTPAGRGKWTKLSQPDADDEVTFTEEQIAASQGIPPEVVRSLSIAAGVYGKPGYGKWA